MSQVELTTLGKSCEFFNGKAHEKSIDENGKYIVVNSKFISSEGKSFKRTNEQLFPLYKGDIVMVMSDVPNGRALAKCFIIDKDDTYSLNQRICCIRSKEFETKYLYYQLNRHEHFLAFNNGENQTNLRKDDILACPLLKPTMDEQRRIVTELDEIYGKINQAKENITKNIENTNDIFQSVLIEALKGKIHNTEKGSIELFNKLKTAKSELIKAKAIMDKKDNNIYPIKDLPFEIPKNWCWAYLSDVSIIQEGPGIRKHQYKNDGVQFLTVTNILEGSVDLEKSKKYISKNEYSEKYTHFTINKGDIVTACSGGTWGKSAIYDCDEILMLNTSTLRMRFFNDLGDNRYLYYLTKAKYFKHNLSQYSTGQQPNYGYSHYSKIPIPIPPFDVQIELSRILEEYESKISDLLSKYEMKLEVLTELEKTIHQNVFSEKSELIISE